MQKKFKALLKSFRDRHGFGEEGEKANISALPEETSEIDLRLEEIHNDIEEMWPGWEGRKRKRGEEKLVRLQEQNRPEIYSARGS
jgi:hypothetical protein